MNTPPTAKAAPPMVPAADGVQTIPAYKAPENEVRFVESLYEDERRGKLPAGIAGQVDCIQLRKVFGITLIASNETREHLENRAKEFDVDPVF